MLDTNFITSILIFILVLYSGILAPNLPEKISQIFNNDPFKLLIIFMIVYMSSLNPQIAILIAIGFALSLQSHTRNQLYDKLSNLINFDIFTNTKNVKFNDEPEIINNYDKTDVITNNNTNLNDFYKLNNNDIFNMNNNISNDNNFQWDFYADDYNYANF
jgi:hypothetical protein